MLKLAANEHPQCVATAVILPKICAGMAYLEVETAGLLARALLLGRQWPRLYPVVFRPVVALVLLLPQVRVHVAALLTGRGLAVECPCLELARAVVDLSVPEEPACSARLLACAS